MAWNRTQEFTLPSACSGSHMNTTTLSDVRWTSLTPKRLITAFALVLLLALSFSAFVLFCSPLPPAPIRPPSAALDTVGDGLLRRANAPSRRSSPRQRKFRKSTLTTTGAGTGNAVRIRSRDAAAGLEYPARRQEVQRKTKDLWCTYNGQSSFFTVRDLPLQLCRRVVHCCITLLSPGGRPGRLYDFEPFLALKRSPALKPQLFVGLGGPYQDTAVFETLYKNTDATSRLARNVVRFVASNHLDGLLFYVTVGGDVAFNVFSELHHASTSRGFLAAVAVPFVEQVSRYIRGNLFPIIRLPPVLSRRWKAGCPAGAELRIDPNVGSFLMQSVTFAGVKYRLASAEAAEEDAPGTLAGTASYADVCTAVRLMGWKGIAARSGDCIAAHNGTQWMASLTPWSGSLARAANGSGGIVILDVEMDDVHGACGHDFPLTRTVHSLL